MESAIPPHLTVARSRPTRVPDDFVPAYPSFVARIPESVGQVVMAYLGAQDGEPDIDTGSDGPRHHDRARVEGTGELVVAAYWDDVAAFDRWFARCREPWLDGPGGRWVEVHDPAGVEVERDGDRVRVRPRGSVCSSGRGRTGPVARRPSCTATTRFPSPSPPSSGSSTPGAASEPVFRLQNT
jgi:hypothetical protein